MAGVKKKKKKKKKKWRMEKKNSNWTIDFCSGRKELYVMVSIVKIYDVRLLFIVTIMRDAEVDACVTNKRSKGKSISLEKNINLNNRWRILKTIYSVIYYAVKLLHKLVMCKKSDNSDFRHSMRTRWRGAIYT